MTRRLPTTLARLIPTMALVAAGRLASLVRDFWVGLHLGATTGGDTYFLTLAAFVGGLGLTQGVVESILVPRHRRAARGGASDALHADVRRPALVALGLGVPSALLTYLLYHAWSGGAGEQTAMLLFMAAATGALLAPATGTATARLVAQGRVLFSLSWSTLTPCIALVALAVVGVGMNGEMVLLALMLGHAVTGGLMHASLGVKAPRTRSSVDLVVAASRKAAPLAVGAAVWSLVPVIDLAFSRLHGAGAATAFALGSRIPLAVTGLVATSISPLIHPHVIDAMDHREASGRRIGGYGISMAGLGGALAILLLAAPYAATALSGYAGSLWNTAGKTGASAVYAAFSVTAILTLAMVPLSQALIGLHRYAWASGVAVAGIGIRVLAEWAFGHRWGLSGVGWAIPTTMAVLVGVQVIMLRQAVAAYRAGPEAT